MALSGKATRNEVIEEIAAAPGLLIELHEGAWRLFEVNGFTRQPLAEAKRDGAVLFYRQDFGAMHGLPPGNWLTGDRVAQVVVGWAPDARCWLLGLQLREPDKRRWCELLRFPPSPRDAYSTQAQRAARALAEALNAPLRVIHDPVVTTPVQPPAAQSGVSSLFERPPTLPAMVQPPLPPPAQPVPYTLPVYLDARVLKSIPAGLRLAHTGRWVAGQVAQLLFNLGLIVVFGFISTRALTTPYAPVNEVWLPYAGLGVMVALALTTIWQGVHLLRAADIVFDRERGALYYVVTLGRWLRPLRRQARKPMPLRAVRAVAARNLSANRNRGEWLVFVQTASDAVVLGESTEKIAEGRTPQAVQAAAAIAELLGVPLRVLDRGE